MEDYHYEDGLESSRLKTRFIQKEDWRIWEKFYSDEWVDEFLPTFGETEPAMKAKKWIDHQIKRYEEKNFGMQWLIDKKTGVQIGQCGLLFQEINGTPELEIGYSLIKPYWGMGYATEAAQLFRDYEFGEFDVDSIISLIDPMNVRSQNVARRNGMKKQKMVNWKGFDLFVWRIARDEWTNL